MIDLHLHLDGSLSIEDFKYLANRYNYDLGSDFPNNIYVNSDCKSLEEYLERFNLPLQLLQDEFSVAYAVSSLVNRLYQMGYIYAEIRFAPQLHTQKGMSQENAVIAACAGLRNGLRDKKNFNAKLILCCMRQADYETNLPAIILADKYRNAGVAAVDLAGPEAFKTGDNYAKLFDEAKERNLNITIHAGEACGSDEVIRCVDLLHAQRIGHGVHLELNRDNIMKMTMNNIAFEFCPTSNLQTTSLPSYQHVPLREFDRYGIRVTINSDNMTVSNTNVLDEYRHMYKTFNIQKYEVRHFLINSINASFTSMVEKQALLRELDLRLTDFYNKIIEE
ncbi:MAG: adenosine deaminase [Bacilli bacterium]|nr:adenosine deaminase [Bacilli bacterium]